MHACLYLKMRRWSCGAAAHAQSAPSCNHWASCEWWCAHPEIDNESRWCQSPNMIITLELPLELPIINSSAWHEKRVRFALVNLLINTISASGPHLRGYWTNDNQQIQPCDLFVNTILLLAASLLNWTTRTRLCVDVHHKVTEETRNWHLLYVAAALRNNWDEMEHTFFFHLKLTN